MPGDNKVCAKVKRTTALHYSATGAATITTAIGNTVNAGRFVLVQRRPGAVHGRVWADPDLSGRGRCAGSINARESTRRA